MICMYADGFTTSVQCDMIWTLYVLLSYAMHCLPHCMHVLIIRRRQAFWGRPGTEATFCCCSTVYIYNTYTVMGVLYMHCMFMTCPC